MLFICLRGSSQFSFHVFPLAVHGDIYSDTVLNTQTLLKKAGIKQVTAHQTASGNKRNIANKIVHLNNDGNIENATVCLAIDQNTKSFLCINDTIIYDDLSRISKVTTSDNKSNKYPHSQRIYPDGLGIDKSYTEVADDSLMIYHLYNNSGQLVNLRKVLQGKEIENTSFYYHSDGLLDSTYNPAFGTFVFKRKKQGNDKLIEMTNFVATYRWLYNSAGQCLHSMYILKERPDLIRKPGYNGDCKTEFQYDYNANGTLSKVTTKSFQAPDFVIYYSYL